MSSLRKILRLAARTVVLASTVLLLTPQEASACTVGIGYRPSVNINDLFHPRTCSTDTSLVGVWAVAVLVIGALAAAGWGAYRKGERESEKGATAPLSGGENKQPGPSEALTTYLDATGIAPAARSQDHAS